MLPPNSVWKAAPMLPTMLRERTMIPRTTPQCCVMRKPSKARPVVTHSGAMVPVLAGGARRVPAGSRENGDVMAGSLADASRPLGVELGPAGVQPVHLGPGGLDGGVPALEFAGVGGDAGVLGGEAAGGQGGLGLL